MEEDQEIKPGLDSALPPFSYGFLSTKRGWQWVWMFSKCDFPSLHKKFIEKKVWSPCSLLPTCHIQKLWASPHFFGSPYQFCLFTIWSHAHPTPPHTLHIHLVKLHHWPAFQQPAPHQCQKVYLVCKPTKPNRRLYTAWNSAAVFTSPPKNHKNIYHCMVMLYLSHTSTSILERTVSQTSAHLKYFWGIQHVVAAPNWFLTRKENTFFNHPVEMFSLWANFRNIHRLILRLVSLRAKDR